MNAVDRWTHKLLAFGLMMVVCVCNLVKLICMALLYFSSGPAPLLNIGDAVRSFLDAPDETTKGMCLAGKREIAQYWDEQRGYTPTEPLMWVERRIRWFKACSAWRWIVFTLLYVFRACQINGAPHLI